MGTRIQRLSVTDRGRWVDRVMEQCTRPVMVDGEMWEQLVLDERAQRLLLRISQGDSIELHDLPTIRLKASIRQAVAACRDELLATAPPCPPESTQEIGMPNDLACRQFGEALIAAAPGRPGRLERVDSVMDWIKAQRGTWDGMDRLHVAPFAMAPDGDPLGMADSWLWKVMLESYLLQLDPRRKLPSADESIFLTGPRRVGKTSLPAAILGMARAEDYVSEVRSPQDVTNDWNFQALARNAMAVVWDECSAVSAANTQAVRSRLTATMFTARSLSIAGDRNAQLRVPRQCIHWLTANDPAMIPAEVMARRIIPLEVTGPNPEVIPAELIARADETGDSAVRLWMAETAGQRWAQLQEQATGGYGDVEAMLPVCWRPSREKALLGRCKRFIAVPEAQKEAEERQADLTMAVQESLSGGEHCGLLMTVAQAVLGCRQPNDAGKRLRAAGWDKRRVRHNGRLVWLWRGPDWDGATVVSTLAGWQAALKPPEPSPPESSPGGAMVATGAGAITMPAPGLPDVPRLGDTPLDGMAPALEAVQRGEVPRAMALMMGTATPGSLGGEESIQDWLGQRGFIEPDGGDRRLAELLGRPRVVDGVKGRTFWRPNRILHYVEPRYAEDSDVTHLTACFLDWDDAGLPTQWERVKGLALPPTAIVWTGSKSLHCYWVLLTPALANEANIPVWRAIQRGLIASQHADPAIVNPSRMMAHPYSPHSNGVRPMVHLMPEYRRYTLEELHQAFVVPELDGASEDEQRQKHQPVLLPGGKAAVMQTWAAIVERCLPTGGKGTGTYEAQRAMVWSSLDWAAEQGLPADATHPVILRHLSDRPRDTPRLLANWQPGKHGAGTFHRAGQAAGLLPRR